MLLLVAPGDEDVARLHVAVDDTFRVGVGECAGEVRFFLMADEEYSYVSSTLMKQVFLLGGRVDGLIPPLVEERMREKLK